MASFADQEILAEHMSAEDRQAADFGGGVQPANPESVWDWQRTTLEQLSTAKALTRQARKHCAVGERTRAGASKTSSANTAGVAHTIRKKMLATANMIKTIEDRIEGVEDTMRHAGKSLFQLQREHRSKWAPLNVCLKRLEMRDGRPMSESVRDHTQEALEQERDTLIQSRNRLTLQMQKLQQHMLMLDSAKVALVEDLQHKRHALRVDRGCLSPKQKLTGAPGTGRERLILPNLEHVTHYAQPPCPMNAEKGTGGVHEENRQCGAKNLIAEVSKLQDDADRLCSESEALMQQAQRDCTRAGTNSQKSIAQRVDETDLLKRRLESQIHETGEAILQSEISLQETRKKLESHETPLRALDKQFAIRGKRTQRERIRDPVQEEMEDHLESVKKNVQLLTNKLQATKDLIDQLQKSKRSMQEDYRAKMLALRIDDACLKVTPRKSMALDRMDPRGGRCRSAKSARPTTLSHYMATPLSSF